MLIRMTLTSWLLSQIKFIRLPDEVLDAVKEQQARDIANKHANRGNAAQGRGDHHGSRGDRGGRGRGTGFRGRGRGARGT